jgi:catechol 2,3-dioxygenase-like lactoylglutathione lyase family enzyme
MEQRVSLITLGVVDLQRSRDFYERLGWKRANAKVDEIVFFQAGGMGLALSTDRACEGCERLPRWTWIHWNHSRIQRSHAR